MEHNQNEENNHFPGTAISCEESLDIRQVDELKPKLLQALEAEQAITIQAQKVERADTAGLQLLATFFIDARARELAIKWDAPSETLIKAANLIGLGAVLGLE